METRAKQDTSEVPMVQPREGKDIAEVVASMIKDISDDEQALAFQEDHLVMLQVQHGMKKFMDGNFSIDKSRLLSVKMRCEEVLKYLDLIVDASCQHRYKSNDVQHGGRNG